MIMTAKDYFEWSGIDLNLELKNLPSDNPSRAVEIFLNQEETWLKEVLTYEFDNTDEEVDAIEPELLKRALCYQIDNIRANGLLRYNLDFHSLPLDKNAKRVLRCYTNISRNGSKGGWFNGSRFI